MARRRPAEVSIRQLVLPALRGRGRTLAALAVVALTIGVIESGFIVLIAQLALSLSRDGDQLNLSAAGADVELSYRAAFLLLAAALPLRLGLAATMVYGSARLTTSVVAATRKRLAMAFLQAPWPVQAAERSGRLQELAGSYTERLTSVLSSMLSLLGSVISLATLVITAVVINVTASVMVIAVIVVASMILRPLRRAIRRRSRRARESNLEYVTSLTDYAAAILEVNVFDTRRSVGHRIGGLIDSAADHKWRATFITSMLQPVYLTIVFSAVIVALGIVYAADVQDVASLGSVFIVMLRAVSYAQTVQSTSANLQNSAPYLERLWAQFDIYAPVARPTGTYTDVVRTLAASRLTYEYEPGQPVLHDLDFAMARGEVIGVVGPSGSGKSTLVQLILRLREPTGGELLVNGTPARELPLDGWVRHITFVPQDSHLVHGTVAENIRFFRDDVTDDEVVAAAQRAHVHDDIVQWPDGYGTVVGAGARQLSGGQRQRLTIARAMVERPDVLILDEPTSALDVHSEMAIRATLDELRRDMLVIVIAHRLSTLTICDRIMVLQDGRITAFAPSSELEHTSAFFKEALDLSGSSG